MSQKKHQHQIIRHFSEIASTACEDREQEHQDWRLPNSLKKIWRKNVYRNSEKITAVVRRMNVGDKATERESCSRKLSQSKAFVEDIYQVVAEDMTKPNTI